jgi:PTH1 family peptidyl-tRNA hydrolase
MRNNDQFRLIVGLGNPGRQYVYNRHNIGFRVVDALADEYHAQWRTKNEALVTSISLLPGSPMLAKPQTFMNESGRSIAALLKALSVSIETVVVVHDELELPFGTIKVKKGGSHRGHNGLRSIIQCCGPDFTKISFGIGRPAVKEQVPDYVLSDFSRDESGQINSLIDQAVLMIKHLCGIQPE